MSWEKGPFAVFGGKFGPNFGIAWDAAPGVYGTDLAEEYELAERIGLGASASASYEDAGLGSHTLSASTFFLDTSGLACSAFTRRQKTRRDDGGPGNTQGFDSFAVGLDGTDFGVAAGLRYHVSFVLQGKGADGEKDETSYAGALEYAIDLGDDLAVTPLIEYVAIDAAEGVADQFRSYLTGALSVAWRGWNLAMAGTRKETDPIDATRTKEEIVQVSAGYAFANGIGVDVGWKRALADGIDTDTAGVLLTHTLSF